MSTTPNCDTKQKRFTLKNYSIFFLIGIFFGIVLTKSEVISWYRIFEMFRFQSFHMYGIIGTAVVLGIIMVQSIKKAKVKSITKETITFNDKAKTYSRYLIGGTIFGLGWAMSGACPGPLFALLGNGFGVIAIVIASAMLGTFVYGLVKDKLPH